MKNNNEQMFTALVSTLDQNIKCKIIEVINNKVVEGKLRRIVKVGAAKDQVSIDEKMMVKKRRREYFDDESEIREEEE
jgi:hypothetical protein